MRLILAVLVCVGCATAVSAQTYPDWKSIYVNDFAEVIDPSVELEIEKALKAARTERDLEMTVVTIESLAAYGFSRSIERYATNLFNQWGVGDATRNDGILMLVSVEDRKIRIALGHAYPARFDGLATRIIERDMVPAFRAGDMGRGILTGTRSVLRDLRLDADAAETGSEFETRVPFFQRLAEIWADWPGLRGLVYVIGSIGAFFGANALYERRPRKCPQCAGTMIRLGDVQEDQYLNSGQLLEERLKSKNYDVFLCPNDEHLTIEGRALGWFSAFKSCPKCGFRTYETSRKVIAEATYDYAGQAELTHYCQHCDHRTQELVTIPQKTRDSSGSYSGGGSSFGGGGGFGGGSSGGGGGSGSW